MLYCFCSSLLFLMLLLFVNACFTSDYQALQSIKGHGCITNDRVVGLCTKQLTRLPFYINLLFYLKFGNRTWVLPIVIWELFILIFDQSTNCC